MDKDYRMPQLLGAGEPVMIGDKSSAGKTRMSQSKLSGFTGTRQSGRYPYQSPPTRTKLRQSGMMESMDSFGDLQTSQLTGFTQSQVSGFQMDQSFASVIPQKKKQDTKLRVKKKGGLTKEQLHPEKYFFQKKTEPPPKV